MDEGISFLIGKRLAEKTETANKKMQNNSRIYGSKRTISLQ